MKPVIIIAIAFVLLIPITAFAQQYQISVQTDYDEYYLGDEVVIFGNVSPLIEDSSVSVSLFSKDSLIAIELVPVSQDGSYTVTFVPDVLWEEGNIIVKADYYDSETENTFVYDPNAEILENGCFPSHPYLWEDGMCYVTMELSYKESEMGFYNNERYEFSFEAPMNWSYQEGISLDQGVTTFEVIQFPTEFSLENAGDDANMLDLGMSMSGVTFQFESPLIYVDFENIPKSKVLTLSEKNLKDYLFDKIVTTYPSAKMIDSWTVSHDWGWEVYAMYNYDLNIGYGSGIPYVTEEFLYVFDDRESYTVGYGAPDVYFDEYRPVFDNVLETITIKSVAVPEFGSIAMLVLVVSVISIIVISRRFSLIRF